MHITYSKGNNTGKSSTLLASEAPWGFQRHRCLGLPHIKVSDSQADVLIRVHFKAGSAAVWLDWAAPTHTKPLCVLSKPPGPREQEVGALLHLFRPQFNGCFWNKAGLSVGNWQVTRSSLTAVFLLSPVTTSPRVTKRASRSNFYQQRTKEAPDHCWG